MKRVGGIHIMKITQWKYSDHLQFTWHIQLIDMQYHVVSDHLKLLLSTILKKINKSGIKVKKVETTNLTSLLLCLAVVEIRTREIAVQIRDQ